jgi:hydroxymethylpyrimidine pyrophosphatase-like HAD family hydrolase
MVATDLDGTIVLPDQSVSPRTVAALEACADAGVHVVFVTGRPPRWMAPVVEATGRTGTAVCANGALVYDLVTAEVVHAHELPARDVQEVARRLRAVLPGAAFALETRLGFRREAGYQTRWDTFSDQDVGGLAELLADDPGVVKLLVRVEGATSDELLDLARPLLDGLGEPTHSNARDNLLEVSAPGVSKASTLADLAARRGVAAQDVVAFGDMPNDVAMLAWAGRGFAMAGGHPDAVRAADALAPPCAEDGVAQVLEALLAGCAPPAQGEVVSR